MRISDWSSDVCSSDLAETCDVLERELGVVERLEGGAVEGELVAELGRGDGVGEPVGAVADCRDVSGDVAVAEGGGEGEGVDPPDPVEHARFQRLQLEARTDRKSTRLNSSH